MSSMVASNLRFVFDISDGWLLGSFFALSSTCLHVSDIVGLTFCCSPDSCPWVCFVSWFPELANFPC